MTETATYKINQCPVPSSELCACGHPMAAHGSNGYVCCACECRKFDAVSVVLEAVK